MKKLALLIGLFAFLILAGIARATDTWTCDSCANCNNNISIASAGDTVLVISNITLNEYYGICVTITQAGIVFDCQNYTIEATPETAILGILLTSSADNTTIRNCNIKNFYNSGEGAGSGISISNASDNLLFDNIYVGGSFAAGIGIAGPAGTANSVFNNIRSTMNSENGFGFAGSNNILSNSKIWGNPYGISNNGNDGNNGGNLFYNNLLNNTVNYDNRTATGLDYWNTTLANGTNIIGGSQIGGNYWAYPNGTGYSQTCDNANNDSFCDSPYNFNPTDYLPLTDNYSSDTTPPDITWNTPANNSFTLNSSEIDWNASLSETPDTCILNINGTANYSMLISGNDCYYTTSNLTNLTTYCGIVYANDTAGNMNISGTQCATINLTSFTPIPPSPRLIDNIGLFGSVALLVIGAGIILFLLEALFSGAELLRNPKGIMLVIIGAIIMAAMILALL